MLKKQIISFIFVGIINTIFGYLVYSLYIFMGFNYILAVFFATVIGILFNFKTISRYVFKKSDNSLLVKFFLVYGAVFLANILSIKMFKTLGFDDYLSGFLAIPIYATLSFVLNKYYVFRD